MRLLHAVPTEIHPKMRGKSNPRSSHLRSHLDGYCTKHGYIAFILFKIPLLCIPTKFACLVQLPSILLGARSLHFVYHSNTVYEIISLDIPLIISVSVMN